MGKLLDKFKRIFFPKNFYEEYIYLGNIPNPEHCKSDLFEMLKPLIVYMDYIAKPYWVPRWFLRAISILRLNNNDIIYNFVYELTNGVHFLDYKFKYYDYDLRMTVIGPISIRDLADSIESRYFNTHRRDFLISILGDIYGNDYNLESFELWKLEDLYEECKF